MNTKTLAANYDRLTGEERFRLILAASERGDVDERGRLGRAGDNNGPYAHAFNELSTLTYIELQEDVARYMDAWTSVDSDGHPDGSESSEEGNYVVEVDGAVLEVIEVDNGLRLHERLLQLALAAGYTVKAKVEGWKLFCERIGVPPFLTWREFPGFKRLERTLKATEQAAFLPEGFLRWLNRIRPKGSEELAESPLTAEGLADSTEHAFRQRVLWWGGY